ncbi:MAG: hypothetical protein KatS3mg023_0585 [Armatimonadota bacterium]|nr:MAG: hypothetical protein KatS3mg023_0585 [Armatimonadota bacterium]
MAFGNEYTRALQQAKEHQRLWRQKIQRLREILAGVPRGQQLSLSVEETQTNYALLNVTLKAFALTRNIRGTRVIFHNAPREIEYWFNDDVKGVAVQDFQDMLKDRFGCGMGVLGIGSDGGSFIQYIDPLDVWWDPDFGYRSPSWVIRRIRRARRVVYEYWDTNTHAFFNESEGVLHEEENPLRIIPIRFLENIYSVPGIDFPRSDTEQVIAPQNLISEALRSLIDQARRGVGFFEYQISAVDPLEIEKLKEPGEQFVGTETGNAITPKITPPPSPEWLNIITIAKNDIDALSGVSEYLRGAMPVANNLKFATQVLAVIGSQNMRIDADWVPVKELLEWAAYVWLSVAHVNRERHRVNDIVIDASTIDISQVSVKCEEDENAFSVSSVGITPDDIASTFAGGS